MGRIVKGLDCRKKKWGMAEIRAMESLYNGEKIEQRIIKYNNDLPMNRKPRKGGRQEETKIQLAIIRWLRIHGVVVGKTKITGSVGMGSQWYKDPYSFRGFPDLVIFHENKLYFIEVKTPTGKLSTEQLEFKKLAEGAGIPYIVARSA